MIAPSKQFLSLTMFIAFVYDIKKISTFTQYQKLPTSL